MTIELGNPEAKAAAVAAAVEQAPVTQAPVTTTVQTVPPIQQLDPNQFSSQPGVSSAPAAAAPVTQAPPAQAPVTPPAAVPPTEMTLVPPPVYKHESTGNAAYDIAMTAFAEKGFSPDHPAFGPATKGDFTALEAWAKESGVDANYIALAKQAHEQISTHYEATHGATVKQALELAGGPERWAKVQDWVSKTADAGELKEWATELEAGGKRTLAAAKYLSDLYGLHAENQPGTKPADPFTTNSSPSIATNGAPLSKEQFVSEMGKLIDKIGYSGLEKSPEYQALQQRRLAWRG